jgi:hypothetical protein
LLRELTQFGFGGKCSIEEKVRCFQERGPLGKLFDSVASIDQHAFLAIDEADLGVCYSNASQTDVLNGD